MLGGNCKIFVRSTFGRTGVKPSCALGNHFNAHEGFCVVCHCHWAAWLECPLCEVDLKPGRVLQRSTQLLRQARPCAFHFNDTGRGHKLAVVNHPGIRIFQLKGHICVPRCLARICVPLSLTTRIFLGVLCLSLLPKFSLEPASN